MRIIKATWFAVIGVVVSLFVVGAAWALPPRVTWEPERLAPASVAPGESATYSVSLKHTGILPIPATLQLRIVPEGGIAPFVTVTPPVFPPVFKRGDRVSVQVTVTAPPDAPLIVVKGKLLLERILPNGAVMDVFRAEALPVELIVSPFPVAADPGEAGKVTVEGIDSNGNGVRDDVERWIVFEFSSSPKTVAAVNQNAVALGYGLSPGARENPEDAKVVVSQKLRAFDCLRYVLGDDVSRAIEIDREVLANVMNTRDRTVAYSAFNNALAGRVVDYGAMFKSPAEYKMACDGFDPDTLGE